MNAVNTKPLGIIKMICIIKKLEVIKLIKLFQKEGIQEVQYIGCQNKIDASQVSFTTRLAMPH